MLRNTTCLLIAFAIVASVRCPAFADDGTADDIAITNAVDAFYLGNIYSSIDWNNGVVIAQVPPYAMFYGTNGGTAIETLVEEANGTWKVILPGKGIIEQDLLTSYGLSVATAQQLLLECPPTARQPTVDRTAFNRPTFFWKMLSGRRVRVRIVRRHAPAMQIRSFDRFHRVHRQISEPFDFYDCLS